MNSGINPALFTDDLSDPDLIEGLAAYDGNDWVTAEPPLRRAAERGNVTAIFKLANTVSNLGREDEAMPLWQLASDQGHEGAANNLSLRLKDLGRINEALSLQERAARGGSLEAMFNVGVTLNELGRTDEAYEWLERAIDAGYGRAAAYLGSDYLAAGRRDDALDILHRGVDLGNMSACLMLAVDAQRRGDYPVVVEWASRAFEMPDDPNETHQLENAWGLLGWGLHMSGRTREAIEPLQRAVELGNEDAQPVLDDALEELERPPMAPAEPPRPEPTWASMTHLSPPSAAPPPTAARFCTACGQPLGDAARFCAHCGASTGA